MRTVFCWVVWICLATSAAAADPTDTARRLFDRGVLQEGLRILKTAIGDDTAASEQRFAAAVFLARFYANRVGDYPNAVRYYRRALETTGTEDLQIMRRQAETELAGWLALEAAHRSLNRTVRQMRAMTFQRIAPDDRSARQALVDNTHRLQRIIDDQPAYYRIHEVHYTLGLTFLALDRPYRAFRAFEKAVSAKPAMQLAQPISRLQRRARLDWMRSSGRQAAWIVAGLLLGILGVVGIRSRPWVWVQLRHLLAGLMVIFAWTALFYVSFLWLGNVDDAGRIINSDGIYPPPVYIHTAPGTPGSEVAEILFFYGLVTVCGTFLFAVATGRMPDRFRATVINMTFALVFAGALATLYYLDYCDNRGRFYATASAVPGLPDGYLAYPMRDPEPYLLINPLYYRDLELSSISDPVLIKWLESYAAISKPAHGNE